MIPYRDENETQRTPYITGLIIALNVLVWIFIQGAGEGRTLAQSVCELGLIPAEITASVPPGTRIEVGPDTLCQIGQGQNVSHLLTSMFLHGSWMHLIGNMWFLWIFGNNIEDSMGRIRFIVFYILAGLTAAGLQIFISPDSTIPMVGASGAISGVMGAYLVLYPRVRVFAMVPLGFILTSVALPAWLMLIYWMFIQFVGGLQTLGQTGGGVAFWAHVGGFVAGVILIKLFARRDYVQEHRSHHWRPRRVFRASDW
jgi:membrane associated rhomboid family serine protease